MLCLNKLSVSTVPWKFGRPTFFGGQIPQCSGYGFIDFGSGSSILGWIPIRIRMQSLSRVLLINKWKSYSWKQILIFFFYPKHCYNLSLGLLKERPSYRSCLSPQKRTSSTLNIKDLNFFLFWWSFLPSWIRIRHCPDWIQIGIRNSGIPEFYYDNLIIVCR